MKGKHICQRLKEIRMSIAQANDIDYTPAQCDHKGDCSGTCPQCEKEVRYIERQLLRRNAMGKVAVVAGLALGATAFAPTVAQPQSQPSINATLNSEPALVNLAPNDPNAIILKGVVIDNNNREPLIGASIRVKDGTKEQYTNTNIDGKFAVKVSQGATLLFQYVGYDNLTMMVAGPNDNLTVLMKDDESFMGEVEFLPPKMPDVDADIYEMR